MEPTIAPESATEFQTATPTAKTFKLFIAVAVGFDENASVYATMDEDEVADGTAASEAQSDLDDAIAYTFVQELTLPMGSLPTIKTRVSRIEAAGTIRVQIARHDGEEESEASRV